MNMSMENRNCRWCPSMFLLFKLLISWFSNAKRKRQPLEFGKTSPNQRDAPLLSRVGLTSSLTIFNYRVYSSCMSRFDAFFNPTNASERPLGHQPVSFWPSQEERCKWSCPTDSCEHRPLAPIKAIIRPSRQSGLPTRLGIGWLRMVEGMGRIGWGGGWLYFFPLFMRFILHSMHLSNESWHWKYMLLGCTLAEDSVHDLNMESLHCHFWWMKGRETGWRFWWWWLV